MRVENLRLSDKSAQDFLDQHKELVDEAGDLYTLFTEKGVDADYFIEIEWPAPEDQILLGKATAIGYRSDKWEKDGHYIDYIHRHEKPLPDVIIGRPSHSSRTNNVARDALIKVLDKQPSIKKAVARPKKMIFAFLGYALDLEFERDGQIMQLDWKEEKKLPLMARTVQRNILVIQPQDGGTPVLLRSPILKVTAAGLEN